MARKCALVIQNQNETFNGQTEQSDKQLYLSVSVWHLRKGGKTKGPPRTRLDG